MRFKPEPANSSQYPTSLTAEEIVAMGGGGGAQGFQGSSGGTGAQGAQGRQGANGAQGLQGAQGGVSSPGAQGTQGSPGAVQTDASLLTSGTLPVARLSGDVPLLSNDSNRFARELILGNGSAGSLTIKDAAEGTDVTLDASQLNFADSTVTLTVGALLSLVGSLRVSGRIESALTEITVSGDDAIPESAANFIELDVSAAGFILDLPQTWSDGSAISIYAPEGSGYSVDLRSVGFGVIYNLPAGATATFRKATDRWVLVGSSSTGI